MRVILAEKPSVARDLAQVLGTHQRKSGYLEGKGWAVTWALGHLVELKEPHEYHEEWKRWSLDTLPLLPETFLLRPRGDKGAKDQLKVVVGLFKEAEELICATDAGREGELIFRYIQHWAKATRKPFRRLWISSLTPASIKDGFKNLVDGHEYDPLYHAARCRSEADWIIGMNATRYHTVAYGTPSQLWSVGRVQTPVLALIVNRDHEIDQFKPETSWLIVTRYREVRFVRQGKRVSDADQARAIIDAISGNDLTIDKVTRKQEKIPPPQLYDLSSLQQDMNKWFGLTADQTLTVAQGLYESKYVTYPRTDSRYLTNDLKEKVPQLLNGLRGDYADEIGNLDLEKLNFSKRTVDDKKVTDHHAIIATEVIPQGLSGDQKKVYDAIVRRFIAVWYPHCVKDVTTVEASVLDERFKATGRVPVDWGWQHLYPNLQKQKPKGKEGEDESQQMPEMTEGEQGPHEPSSEEKQTTPPKRYTEATLLKQMETAGKLVDDEALAEAMKQRGLGTPATRAAIIETLIQRKYIERRKKAVVSTPSGRHLLHVLQDESLRSPELTGDWEAKLKDIEQAKRDPDSFMAEIRNHAVSLVKAVPPCRPDDGGLGPCPTCGKPVIQGKKGFGCSGYKEGCDFVLWGDACGADWSPALVREVLASKRSLTAHPVKENDEPALGVLVMAEDGTVSAEIIKTKTAKGTKSLGACPLCGSAIVAGQKAYGCSAWQNGCPFRIWKTIAGKNITQAVVKTLLAGETTEELDGFTSRAGKPFKTRLKIEGGKAVFKFD